jgi:hypothetical protein
MAIPPPLACPSPCAAQEPISSALARRSWIGSVLLAWRAHSTRRRTRPCAGRGTRATRAPMWRSRRMPSRTGCAWPARPARIRRTMTSPPAWRRMLARPARSRHRLPAQARPPCVPPAMRASTALVARRWPRSARTKPGITTETRPPRVWLGPLAGLATTSPWRGARPWIGSVLPVQAAPSPSSRTAPSAPTGQTARWART